MRIAIIGHKRIPGREGGIEVVVEELAIQMAAKGHEVYVYNRKSKHKKVRKEYKGVHIITVPTIEKKSTDAVVYSFLASIHALFGRYDVIHYHALGPSVMLIIPKLLRKRIIVTVHGLNYKTPKWKGLGAKFIQLGEKITAKYADEIIVLSREQEKYLLEKYNRKSVYIPNGTVMEELIPPSLIQKKWGLEKEKYILFVSRIVPGKGIEHLVEAYKKIKTDMPLLLVGESTYVDEFYDELKKSVSEDGRIQFLGFASGQALQELYSNAYLFVFPSEAEGMPMCLLEAMSYNTPCLVSDIPENLEVGKNYVQSFQVANVDDLQEKLQLCIDNREELFNKNSREYIRKNFSWENVVEETLRCYKGEIC